MNACLASTILLFISLVDLLLLEISESRYRKCSVCLIEFPFKKSVSRGTVSSLVTTRHSVLLTFHIVQQFFLIHLASFVAPLVTFE